MSLYLSPLQQGNSLIFLGSSVAEQLTVNQLVVGSNPTRGASIFLGLICEPRLVPFFILSFPLASHFLDLRNERLSSGCEKSLQSYSF